MRRLLTMMVAAVLALGVGACQSAMGIPPSGPVPDDGPAQIARMRQQAADALARWDAAYAAAKQPVFAPLSDFQPGVTGTAPSENVKEILDHAFVVDAQLPSDVPGGTVLRWPSGATRSIVALSAAQAFDAMTARLKSNCSGCTPSRQAHVTGARLSTVPIDSVDGSVTAPAWEYTLAGYSARLVMPAVGPAEALVPPDAAWDSANPPLGLWFDTVKSTSDGTRLTIGFIGARDHADVPCGEDYTAEPVYGAHAIVIILHVHHYQGTNPNGVCLMIGYHREVEVTLDPPLGNRVVLEGRVGHPVPVTVA